MNRENVRHSVGDRVVAINIRGIEDSAIKLGEKYLIEGISYCPYCGLQICNIGVSCSEDYWDDVILCVCDNIVQDRFVGFHAVGAYRLVKLDELPALLTETEQQEDYDTCVMLRDLMKEETIKTE